MKKTAVLLYPQFSEYELSVALSILMQGQKPVVTVGLNSEPIQGESGLTCLADKTFETVTREEFDSLLLPGCMDIFQLNEEAAYVQFIKEVAAQGDVKIASISSSPYLLAKAGLLTEKKYTVGLTKEAIAAVEEFADGNYVDELLVQDGNLITAWGSAFIRFGITFGNALQLDFNDKWYQD